MDTTGNGIVFGIHIAKQDEANLTKELLVVEEWFSDYGFLTDLPKPLRWMILTLIAVATIVGMLCRIVITNRILQLGWLYSPINMMLFIEQLTWIICYGMMVTLLFFTSGTGLFVNDLLGAQACSALLAIDTFPFGFLAMNNLMISIFRLMMYHSCLKTNAECWTTGIIFTIISVGFGLWVSLESIEGLGQNYAGTYCYGKSLDYLMIEHAYRGPNNYAVKMMVTYGCIVITSMVIYITFFASLYKHDEKMRKVMVGHEIDKRHRKNAFAFSYQVYHFIASWFFICMYACIEYVADDPHSLGTWFTVCYYLEFGLCGLMDVMATEAIRNLVISKMRTVFKLK